MRKGKTINLPKPFLRLPVFNQETINYHVKFLGKIAVSRNGRTIPADLLPKDAAFLLHLIMKKEKQLMLDPVYHNLYPGSPAPARDFSHLLVRLKKQLLIPSHLLKIKKSYDHTFLFNSGLYFTSDYSDYLQALAQARALQQAGEWHYARREYLRAFRMFRGEPFHKMYDDWSLDTRHAILTRLETETIAFVENCLKHKNPNDAKMVLQRVRKIIPAYPGSLHEKNLEEFSTQPAREHCQAR
jgi:two-component SAPR family response regulator